MAVLRGKFLPSVQAVHHSMNIWTLNSFGIFLHQLWRLKNGMHHMDADESFTEYFLTQLALCSLLCCALNIRPFVHWMKITACWISVLWTALLRREWKRSIDGLDDLNEFQSKVIEYLMG